MNALKLSAMVVLVPLGIHYGALDGLLWAFALAEFARYTFTVYAVSRVGLRLWRNDLLLTASLGLVFLATASDVVGHLRTVHALADWLSSHVAWTEPNGRALHIVRLFVESCGVALAALLVLAVYWVCFHRKIGLDSPPLGKGGLGGSDATC